MREASIQKAEDFVTIRWHAVTFVVNPDDCEGWVLTWSNGDGKSRLSGPDAPALIAEACASSGLDEETKWEILFAIMNRLRERLFN